MGDMKRRSALRLLGTAPLGVGFGIGIAEALAAREGVAAALRAAEEAGGYAPSFFSEHEWRSVRVLVDWIIPADERSGSATDAGVPEFMDFLMTDPEMDDRSLEQRQVAMRGGLAWIDAECRKRFGHDFVECGEDQQRALLDAIAYEADADDAGAGSPDGSRPDLQVRLEHGSSFFASFRDLTASGFWSSRMGVEDIGYVGNRALGEWTGPPPEVLRKLGIDP